MDLPESSGAMNKPLQLLLEGKQQYIKVDYRVLFDEILVLLGVSKPATFAEIGCGVEGVKYEVTLDLSFCNQSQTAVIEGHPFTCKSTAESSALMLCFLHLEHQCMVKFADLSSRVCRSISADSTFSHVTEALDSSKKALDNFDACFARCMDFALELEGGSFSSKISCILSGHESFYQGIRVFIADVVKEFSRHSSMLRGKISILELQRNQHESVILPHSHLPDGQVGVKKVAITSKYLLKYVLEYFGLKNAFYTNGPDGRGMVDGEVHFTFPESKKLRYGGNIVLKAKGTTYQIAEENAAFEGLMFIEENFRATLIDLNFTHRLDFENEEMKLKVLLKQILELGVNVKRLWERFLAALSNQMKFITSDNNYIVQANSGLEHLAAYKICVDGLSTIEKQADNCFGLCWASFVMLDDLTSKIKNLKLKTSKTRPEAT